MDSTNPDTFPRRPISTAEVLRLQNNVKLFQYTAPFIGLESLEDGPGAESQAVVGIYVGVQSGGAYLMGFDPECEDWETVSAIPSDDIPNMAAMAPYIEELLDWLVRHHPGESFVSYRKASRLSN